MFTGAIGLKNCKKRRIVKERFTFHDEQLLTSAISCSVALKGSPRMWIQWRPELPFQLSPLPLKLPPFMSMLPRMQMLPLREPKLLLPPHKPLSKSTEEMYKVIQVLQVRLLSRKTFDVPLLLEPLLLLLKRFMPPNLSPRSYGAGLWLKPPIGPPRILGPMLARTSDKLLRKISMYLLIVINRDKNQPNFTIQIAQKFLA